MAGTKQFDSDDVEFFGEFGSLGSVKFDKILGGGIPRGFTILAIGDAGAGMDLFSKQFASVSEDPENTVYISTGESQQEILSLFRRYDWPLDLMVRTIGEEYNRTVLHSELEASRFRIEGFNMQDIQKLAQTRFVESEVQDFLVDLTSQITSMGSYHRIAIDNLDFFFQRNDSQRVISMLRVMQAHSQLNRGLLLLTVSSDMVPKNVEREMTLIADIVLSFEVHMLGTEFETRLVVRKFRNAPNNLAVISYRVTPDEGITPETVQRIV